MELYEVLDIYLNAYLMSDVSFIAEEIKVVNTEGKRKVAFYYPDTKELRAAVIDYRENDFLKSYIFNYLATKRTITGVLRDDRRE